MGVARDRTWAVLALMGCAFASLAMGDWISVEADASGGSVPRATVAAVLVVVAVLIALQQGKARRTLGGLLVLVVLLLVAAGFLESFRFVWTSGEPQLFVLKVVLAVVGMGLLAPAYLAPGVASSVDLGPDAPAPAPRRQFSGRGRAVLWFVTGLVGGVAGYDFGGWPGVGVAVVVVAAAWGVVRLLRLRSHARRRSLR